MKALVIGGNPAGMSAASRMKRKAPDTEVIVLEKSHEVSYGACGLPYYVAGLNDDLDRIRIRKAPEFEKNGISVGLGQEVIAVDTIMINCLLRVEPHQKYLRFRESDRIIFSA